MDTVTHALHERASQLIDYQKFPKEFYDLVAESIRLGVFDKFVEAMCHESQ